MPNIRGKSLKALAPDISGTILSIDNKDKPFLVQMPTE